ncbi:MAG: glycosyltransferase [Verrucomicrobiae bacterium]|nr:glycosyltransferase [Verrucomicrobiae bacterium]
MSETLLVSFVIAAWNAGAFLEETVRSCLDQTDARAQLEVVVTDDGSSDDTARILRRLAESDARVRPNSFPENRGKVAAYNDAFARSRGAFLAFMDADDVCLRDRVSASLRALQENDAEMLGGDAIILRGGEVISTSLARDWFGFHSDRALDFDQLLKRPRVLGPTLFGTRAACEAAFPIDERLSHQDWWIPLAAAARRPIRHLDRPLVKYRLHASNTSRVNPGQTFDHWLRISAAEIHYYERILEKFPLTPAQIAFCRERIRMFELLRMDRPAARWLAGARTAPMALRGGIPLRERVKYLLAWASPRISHRLSMAAARRRTV